MTIAPFRGSPRPTLGVELELQLVDAGSLALRGAFADVLACTEDGARAAVKPEFHRCCAEINTGICRDVDEVARDLGARLDALGRAAARAGLRLGWGGTHPFSRWQDQPITPDARYQALDDQYRETLRRQLTFGMHVHVGVPDGDAAVRACDRLREHMPALLALSANSPFWCGRATGMQSHRTEVMSASPIGSQPPTLGDWAGFAALVEHLIDCGAVADLKDLWWDVRPSPSLGTVEVRICDMPPDLPAALALTALIQCLVHRLARPEPTTADDGPWIPLVLQQNRWRAARFGLDAGLAAPHSGRVEPARRVLRDLIDRLEFVGAELGCRRHLRLARELTAGPNGAERQLAVFARTGDLTAVARHQAGAATPAAPTWPTVPTFNPAVPAIATGTRWLAPLW